MIEIEEISPKYTKIYRCSDDINNLKIRVRLKEVEIDYEEIKTFKWQEKYYSHFEKDFYKNKDNCITDLENKYHQEVVNMLDNDELIYSYTNEDNTEFLELKKRATVLTQNVEKLDLNQVEVETSYNFEKSLETSILNPFLSNHFENMFIMVDFGEYFESTWIKSEYILVTIKFNKSKNIFTIYPDFSKYDPYILKIHTDTTRKFEFWIDNASIDNIPEDELTQEDEIFDKLALYEKQLKSNQIDGEFQIPPKNKLTTHIFLEILTGRNFEYDHYYVQYLIDLPKNWVLKKGDLQGMTTACKTKKIEQQKTAFFGFPFEILLEYNIQEFENNGFFEAPFLYFELISKDTWSRFRSEGLAYQKIPIGQPGVHLFDLQCLRIAQKGPKSNLKRFFIGDCCNYDDITWIGISKNHEGRIINKLGTETIGTGQLQIKMQIIHQSEAFIKDLRAKKTRENVLTDKLNSSSLVKSVEQVLDAFKIARNKMRQVKKMV